MYLNVNRAGTTFSLREERKKVETKRKEMEGIIEFQNRSECMWGGLKLI